MEITILSKIFFFTSVVYSTVAYDCQKQRSGSVLQFHNDGMDLCQWSEELTFAANQYINITIRSASFGMSSNLEVSARGHRSYKLQKSHDEIYAFTMTNSPLIGESIDTNRESCIVVTHSQSGCIHGDNHCKQIADNEAAVVFISRTSGDDLDLVYAAKSCKVEPEETTEYPATMRSLSTTEQTTDEITVRKSLNESTTNNISLTTEPKPSGRSLNQVSDSRSAKPNGQPVPSATNWHIVMVPLVAGILLISLVAVILSIRFRRLVSLHKINSSTTNTQTTYGNNISVIYSPETFEEAGLSHYATVNGPEQEGAYETPCVTYKPCEVDTKYPKNYEQIDFNSENNGAHVQYLQPICANHAYHTGQSLHATEEGTSHYETIRPRYLDVTYPVSSSVGGMQSGPYELMMSSTPVTPLYTPSLHSSTTGSGDEYEIMTPNVSARRFTDAKVNTEPATSLRTPSDVFTFEDSTYEPVATENVKRKSAPKVVTPADQHDALKASSNPKLKKCKATVPPSDRSAQPNYVNLEARPYCSAEELPSSQHIHIRATENIYDSKSQPLDKAANRPYDFAKY